MHLTLILWCVWGNIGGYAIFQYGNTPLATAEGCLVRY